MPTDEQDDRNTNTKMISLSTVSLPSNPSFEPLLSYHTLADNNSLDELLFTNYPCTTDPFMDLFDDEERNTLKNDDSVSVKNNNGSSSGTSTHNLSLSILSPDIDGIHDISYPSSSSLSPDTDVLRKPTKVAKLSLPLDTDNTIEPRLFTSQDNDKHDDPSPILPLGNNTTDYDNTNNDPLSDISLETTRIILPPQPTDPLFCLGNTRLRLIHDFFTKRNIYCSSFPVLDPNSFFSMLYNIRLKALSMNEERLAALQDNESDSDNLFFDSSRTSFSSSNRLVKTRNRSVDELYYSLVHNDDVSKGTEPDRTGDDLSLNPNLYESLRNVLHIDTEEDDNDEDEEEIDGNENEAIVNEEDKVNNDSSYSLLSADTYGFRVLYLAVLACGAVSEGRMDVASKLYTAAKSALGPCFSLPSQYLVPALILLSMLHRNINADWGETCVLLALAKEMIFMVNVPRETRLLLLNMSSLHAVNKEEDNDADEETVASLSDSSSPFSSSSMTNPSFDKKKKCKYLVFPSLSRTKDQDPLERLTILIDWCISIIMKDYDEWKLNTSSSSSLSSRNTTIDSNNSDYDNAIRLLNEILTIFSREERLSQSPLRQLVEGLKGLFCFKNNQITDGIRLSLSCINGAADHPLGTHSGMLTLLVYRLKQQLQYLLPIMKPELIVSTNSGGSSMNTVTVNPFESDDEENFLFSSAAGIHTESTAWKEKLIICLAKMTSFLRMADKVQGNYGVMTFVIGPKTIRRHNPSSNGTILSSNTGNAGLSLTNCGPDRNKVGFKRRL